MTKAQVNGTKTKFLSTTGFASAEEVEATLITLLIQTHDQSLRRDIAETLEEIKKIKTIFSEIATISGYKPKK